MIDRREAALLVTSCPLVNASDLDKNTWINKALAFIEPIEKAPPPAGQGKADHADAVLHASRIITNAYPHWTAADCNLAHCYRDLSAQVVKAEPDFAAICKDAGIELHLLAVHEKIIRAAFAAGQRAVPQQGGDMDALINTQTIWRDGYQTAERKLQPTIAALEEALREHCIVEFDGFWKCNLCGSAEDEAVDIVHEVGCVFALKGATDDQG